MKAFAGLKKLLGLGAEEEISPAQVKEAISKMPTKGLGRLHPAEPGFESRDQRYRRVEKIVPPYPLPHVSRVSLRRIKDPLPVPTHCPFCNGPVALDSNDAIYRGRRYGDWPYVYMCEGHCDAYVGLHPNTDIPLGTLADRATREARKEAKALFFSWMHVVGYKNKDRDVAYYKLATLMEIEVAVCHFAMFDIERCNLAMAHLGNLLAEQLQEAADSIKDPMDDDIPF